MCATRCVLQPPAAHLHAVRLGYGRDEGVGRVGKDGWAGGATGAQSGWRASTLARRATRPMSTGPMAYAPMQAPLAPLQRMHGTGALRLSSHSPPGRSCYSGRAVRSQGHLQRLRQRTSVEAELRQGTWVQAREGNITLEDTRASPPLGCHKALPCRYGEARYRRS